MVYLTGYACCVTIFRSLFSAVNLTKIAGQLAMVDNQLNLTSKTRWLKRC